jgi:hypothetical protein
MTAAFMHHDYVGVECMIQFNKITGHAQRNDESPLTYITRVKTGAR